MICIQILVIINILIYYSNISDNNINFSLSNNTMNNHSFMWCEKMTHNEIQSITRYIESPFNDDFYTYVIKSYYELKIENPAIDFKILRDKLKHTMMFVLFENNYAHRNNNPYIRMFQSVFPGVDKRIIELHGIVGSDKFAYLLQRAESYLMLDVVCREFHQNCPTAPLFTIHDGILTFREYLPDHTGFILTRLEDITGISGGAKITYPQIDPESQIRYIEEVCGKIKNITTHEKYDKIRGGVLTSNVERGVNFLESFPKNF